jgi:hypothetical protein
MHLRERFRSAGARGIAHFLAEHQEHDAGFDVHRDEAGEGELQVTCLGCGETVRYRAADVASFADAEAELARKRPRGAAPAPPAGPAGRAPTRADPVPRPPLVHPAAAAAEPPTLIQRFAPFAPRWLGTAAIAALIGAGLLMILIGLLGDDGGEQSPSPSSPPPAAQRQPAQPPPAQRQPARPPAAAPPTATGLGTRTVADRFTIGVAPGWRAGQRDGAYAIIAPGGAARIEVYFERGERAPSALADSAGAFLRERHPGSDVSGPRPLRLSGLRAVRVTDSYAGGTESAVILSTGGFTYLLTERLDAGAPAAISSQADAQLASFKPL